jgi:hypothetical protein
MSASVRPEIQAIVARGSVTTGEVAAFLATTTCNQAEWNALVPAMTDEAFLALVYFSPLNASGHALEILRRFKIEQAALKKMKADYLAACKETYESRAEAKVANGEALAFSETLDAIREALGQKSTHHLVMAGDVLELVDAIEHCDGCRVKVVLQRLREEGAK